MGISEMRSPPLLPLAHLSDPTVEPFHLSSHYAGSLDQASTVQDMIDSDDKTTDCLAFVQIIESLELANLLL